MMTTTLLLKAEEDTWQQTLALSQDISVKMYYLNNLLFLSIIV